MHTSTQPRIAFDDLGDGEPALLLLPGWCAHRDVLRGLAAATAGARRSIAIDWRNHGGSELAGGDYTTADLVDDAIAALDEAGVAHAVPVALSHAGWVAIELRRRLGAERVPAIVLLDWMVLGPPPPFLGALEGLQDPGSWLQVRAGLFDMWTTGVDLPALDENIATMASHDFDDWARAAREIGGQFAASGSPLAALDGLDCPTLHLYAQPADDGYLAAQRAAAADHPGFEVCRLDARSHFPMLEVPGEMAETIEGFVRRHV